MVLLRQEQVQHSVKESAGMVADELAQHKGNFANGNPKRSFLSDDFRKDIFSPFTVGQQFDLEEIKAKFKKAFVQNNLKDIRYEFGIGSFDKNDNIVFEKVTPNFIVEIQDTSHNFLCNRQINELSGTAGENLNPIEILYVVIPNINSHNILCGGQ